MSKQPNEKHSQPEPNEPPETVRRYALRIRASLATDVEHSAKLYTEGPRAAGDSWGALARAMVAFQIFSNQQHDGALVLHMWRAVPVARWGEWLTDNYGEAYRKLTIL